MRGGLKRRAEFLAEEEPVALAKKDPLSVQRMVMANRVVTLLLNPRRRFPRRSQHQPQTSTIQDLHRELSRMRIWMNDQIVHTI